MRPSRTLLLCASIFCTGFGTSLEGRAAADTLTVRIAQAELRCRPSLDSVVTGLMRRGETMEVLRTSADRRWVQVEIGGGELAWIEARAVKKGAVEPQPEREHTLITPRDRLARADDDRDVDDDVPRRFDARREEAPPPPKREPPREVRNDPPPPPPKREPPREVRNDPPPPPPPKREPPREVRNDPPPPPQPVAQEPQSSRPLREITAKPGELFAADLDDERPPSRPGSAAKPKK